MPQFKRPQGQGQLQGLCDQEAREVKSCLCLEASRAFPDTGHEELQHGRGPVGHQLALHLGWDEGQKAWVS